MSGHRETPLRADRTKRPLLGEEPDSSARKKFTREMAAEMGRIEAKLMDAELKQLARSVEEAFQYAEPTSGEACKKLEDFIRSEVAALGEAASSLRTNREEEMRLKMALISSSIKERSRLIRRHIQGGDGNECPTLSDKGISHNRIRILAYPLPFRLIF